MIVNFVYNDKLSSIILPNKISGQFWFSDPNGCNVVRIEGVDNKWVIKTQSQYTVRVKNITTGNSTDITSDEIVSKRLYQIKNLNSIKDRIYLFTEEYTDNRIEFYLFQIPEFFTLTIGNGKVPKTITYDNEYVSANHATIQYSNGQWTLQDDDSKNGTFVNGIRVNTETLKYTAEVLSLAENINAINNNISNALEKVTSAMNSLNGSWSGAAGERAVSMFNSINSGCIEVQRVAIADYANFLKQRISGGYEQIETINISLSDAFK